MKRLIIIAFVFIALSSIGQYKSPLPSTTVKKLISPNNPIFYYSTLDSCVWLYKGIYGWTKLADSAMIHDIVNQYYNNTQVTGSIYKGEMNGSTGSGLVDGVGTAGWYYACSVAGTHDYGSGNITLAIGDQLYYNGSVWLKVPGAGSYTLPTASAETLGGIKIGSGITMTGDVASVSTNYQAPLTGSGLVKSISGTISYITDNSSNWNTAYGWGNHASVGYLTTETDPVFSAHTVKNIINGTGFLKNNGTGTWSYDNNSYSLSTHNHSGVYEPVISTGLTTQYWRGDKTLQTLNTSVVPEGTNLYYTNTRARAAISLAVTRTSGASTYDPVTGILDIPQYAGVGGGGTVTSVGMTVPTGLSITGSPILTSGTLALSLTSGYSIPTTANQTNWSTAYDWGNHASAGYYVGTSSTIRSLFSESVTGLNYASSTGILSLTSGYVIPTTVSTGQWDDAYTYKGMVGYGTTPPFVSSTYGILNSAYFSNSYGLIRPTISSSVISGDVLPVSGGAVYTELQSKVSSVGLSMPSIFTVTGSPVTSSGTLTATLASQSANMVFASPNNVAGTPTFRKLYYRDFGTYNIPTSGQALTYSSSYDLTWTTLNTGSGTSGRVTYWNGTNSITSDASFLFDTTNGLTLTKPVKATEFTFGTTGWTIAESAGKLVFKYNGTAVMSLDQSGNIKAASEIYRGGL